MKDLEGKVFAIGGFHVTFKFKELPNDMKMLATLAGELAVTFPLLQQLQLKTTGT